MSLDYCCYHFVRIPLRLNMNPLQNCVSHIDFQKHIRRLKYFGNFEQQSVNKMFSWLWVVDRSPLILISRIEIKWVHLIMFALDIRSNWRWPWIHLSPDDWEIMTPILHHLITPKILIEPCFFPSQSFELYMHVGGVWALHII